MRWRLRFRRDSEENLKAAAQAEGVDPARLYFSDFVMTSDENFERLHAADLVLDTTIYGAHTGAADALWAGKPLLTCLGPKCATLVDPREQTAGSHEAHLGADCMTARIASSMLVGSGLEEVSAQPLERHLTSACPPSRRSPALARDGLFSKTDVTILPSSAPMNGDLFSSLVFATVAPSAPISLA